MGGDWGHLIFVKQRLRFLPGVFIGILLDLINLIHTLEEKKAGRERERDEKKIQGEALYISVCLFILCYLCLYIYL